MEARNNIHAERGLTDGPEPVSFGKAGFSQEGTGHVSSNTPVTLRLQIKTIIFP
jgi:hypothetical protein